MSFPFKVHFLVDLPIPNTLCNRSSKKRWDWKLGGESGEGRKREWISVGWWVKVQRKCRKLGAIVDIVSMASKHAMDHFYFCSVFEICHSSLLPFLIFDQQPHRIQIVSSICIFPQPGIAPKNAWQKGFNEGGGGCFFKGGLESAQSATVAESCCNVGQMESSWVPAVAWNVMPRMHREKKRTNMNAHFNVIKLKKVNTSL